MSLESRSLERIAKDYTAAEQSLAIELVSGYTGPERERVVWDILELSKGSLDSLRRFVKDAQTDYRDILYWAEYYSTDPLLKDRNPKQMVDDILNKWGSNK